MYLHEFTNEIIDIGSANGMGWHEGAAMFLSNIRACTVPEGEEKCHYAGADQVDYQALVPYLEDLQNSAEGFVSDYQAHTTEIVALRKAGDYEGVKALMVKCAEEREAAEAAEAEDTEGNTAE